MLGHQVIIDLYDCDSSILDTLDRVESAVYALADCIGANVLQVFTHRFEPQGVSCTAQISASHIAIHTWPESLFAAIDVFSCTTRINATDIIRLLQQTFRAGNAVFNEAFRGAGLDSQFFKEDSDA